MFKTTWLSLLLAIFVLGCSSEESSVIQDDNNNSVTGVDQVNDDQNSDSADGKIGYSAMSLKNPFFVIISDSLTEAGAAHGFSVVTTDADSDVNKQANQIEDFINNASNELGDGIDILVNISSGSKNFTAYTMDLTKKYIEINADYRS